MDSMDSKNSYNKMSISNIFAAIFTLHYFYTGFFGPFSVEWHRGFFVMGSVIIILMNNGTKIKLHKNIGLIVDYLLMFILIVTIGFFIKDYMASVFLTGLPPKTVHYISAILLTFILLEGTRRTMGPILPILTLIFIGYAIYGSYIPGLFGHSGFKPAVFITKYYMSSDGIFGGVTNTVATFVFPFVMFSTFFINFGGSDLFINFANLILGKTIGGPAKAAVVSSFFMGMISGSQVGNVVATGSFTIPTMKKHGYPGHIAGAVEASASLGGSMMPPIMGATAFIMAELTGYSYLRIIKAAFVPATMYFLTVFILVHFQSVKLGLSGFESSSSINRKKEILLLLYKYWYMIFPIFLIVYLLLRGYSPRYAAVGSISSLLLFSFIFGDRKNWISNIWDGLIESAKNISMIGCVVGLMGIIIMSVNVSGVALKFAALIYSVSLGHLIIPVILTFLICFILGCGVSVSTSYIICAVVAVPPLLSLNVPLLAAHFLIDWYAQSATVTPPVCMSSFAAASIAKADPMKTGFSSLIFASGLFFIPLLFVFTDILFLETLGFAKAVWLILTILIAILSFCAFVQGWLLAKTSLIERIVLGISSIMLFAKSIETDIFGLVLFTVILLIQFRKSKSKEVFDKKIDNI